ncbi:MAG: nitroreductase family deazaflavin-dependent oxidoreductase [Acidimicrobiia bacterium]|nr:nitroreductase family deazaflavin-dependent oxidoreductase [Acidimicrobiia bacterium]
MTTHPGRTPGSGTAARYETVTSPQTLEMLRRFFRQLNRSMVMMWRLGLGRMLNIWPAGFGRILVIEHIGRRSGTRYRTPVNFTKDGGDLYCVAAFGRRTDWYRNTMADPAVTVWLPDGRWTAVISDASESADRLDLIRRVLIDSGFAARLVGLRPRQMTDTELASATEDYRLVRIRRGHPATPRSPADLAWIWLVAAGLAIAARIRRHTLSQ